MSSLVIRNACIGGARVDVRISGARIEAIERGLRPGPGEQAVDARSGELLPGLHDHHVHLLAMAAALTSVSVGPPEVSDASALRAGLRAADRRLPPGQWLRAVGYHESVAGALDRRVLDAIVAERPVRVQHRSGAQWTVNTAGARVLGLFDPRATAGLSGIERDELGEPTGRLHRLDDWLAARLGGRPDLRPVGEALARYGVTGVTDATPFVDQAGPSMLADAVATGALPQTVVVMGGPGLAGTPMPPPLHTGPVKIVLSDPDLPAIDDVVEWFAAARGAGRGVAVHSVTAASLALALGAWAAVGAHPGDRVEHAAVVPPALAELIRAAGVTVVTQPGFVAERGDQYLTDVDPEDRAYLYPCQSLIARGIPVGGSTDAPYASADPWRAMVAAAGRTTVRGRVLGPEERVPIGRALELFLSPWWRPGGSPRRVAVGARADLVVLDAPLPTALADPDPARVVATIVGGRLVYGG